MIHKYLNKHIKRNFFIKVFAVTLNNKQNKNLAFNLLTISQDIKYIIIYKLEERFIEIKAFLNSIVWNFFTKIML